MASLKESDALARIDERTKIMAEKLDRVEKNTDALSSIVNRHTIVLDGCSGQEGLIAKVEKHEKAYIKTSFLVAILVFMFELLKSYFLRG